jgi:diadenosine tetraphosphatase ApaH/serine/threonine PP2A family protein phosphatase
MRLALIADVHGNFHALQACLAHAQWQGVTHHAFLGDLVGYGAYPSEVVARVMEMVGAGEAVAVLGNHDEIALSPPATVVRNQDAGALWTHDQLQPAQRSFLQALPLSVRWQGCLLVHAGAADPAQWAYVTDAQTAQRSLDAACTDKGVTHVFGGHVHWQTLYYRGKGGRLLPFSPVAGVAIPVPAHRQWLATVGSAGQPRDGDPRAMYALFDDSVETLTFYRVPYDCTAAALAIREAGLPEFFAARLEAGR